MESLKPQQQQVEERFFKKPIPKYLIGQILRIEALMHDHVNYLDKTGIVAGWARTIR